jgi:hypothetical protein
MPNAILAYQEGKPKIIIVSQIKSIEVEPAVREEPAQEAVEAVEGHPGEPADPVTGLGGKPPVEAVEAKEATPGKPGVPETVVVDGCKLGMTAEQFVHLLNR